MGSGCGRQALHGTSNYNNSREHSAHICSHCPTTMSNLQVCVIRLRNYVLHAAASGFCTSTCPGICYNILTREARRTPFMDGRFVSFHMTRGFLIGGEEHRTVVHRRRMTHAGRCWFSQASIMPLSTYTCSTPTWCLACYPSDRKSVV